MDRTGERREGDTAGLSELRLTRHMWVLTVVALLLLSFLPPESARGALALDGEGVLWRLGHVPAYALLIGLSVPLAHALLGSATRAITVSVVFGVALGICVELAQPLTGRTAALADMGLNLLGVTLATVFWAHASVTARRRSWRAERS